MIFAQHPYGHAMMPYPGPGSQFGLAMPQYPMGPQYPPQLAMTHGGAFSPQQQQQQQQALYMGQMARGPQVANANNLFYKTRMCNKWRTGACPFGDKCTYAHGQHEIRRVPPDVVAAHAMQMQQIEMNDAMHKQMQGNVHQSTLGKNEQHVDDQQQNKSQLYYKTRLCIRFMQSGYCVKGNECTFAHGYEDLRLLASSQQQKHSSIAPVRHGDGGKGDHGDNDNDSKGTKDNITEEQARARAMSAIAGVGQAESVADPDKVKEATSALEDGSAFEGGPYSDTGNTVNMDGNGTLANNDTKTDP